MGRSGFEPLVGVQVVWLAHIIREYQPAHASKHLPPGRRKTKGSEEGNIHSQDVIVPLCILSLIGCSKCNYLAQTSTLKRHDGEEPEVMEGSESYVLVCVDVGNRTCTV